MKTTLLSLVALIVGSRFCAGSQTPGLQWDPKTIASCVEWYDNDEGKSCEEVRKYWGITPEHFTEWNPSVGLNCKPWGYQSYCIVTKERLANITTTTTTTSKPTSTTTTSTLGPSPTAWSALGCYVDDSKLPILEKRVSKEEGDAALTIPKCQNACYLASLKFAGVKAGNECWCSSYVGGELASNETECNMPCSGDKDKICGGKDRTNVFVPASVAEPGDGTDHEPTGSDKGKAINDRPANSGAMRNFALF